VKTMRMLILALALAACGAGSLWAATPTAATAGKPQTVCPVLGGNINKQYYADYKGKRIYFCCAGCDQEFLKNPEKYMQKLEEQGVELEPSPAGAAQKKAVP
jgi:YHS domain-containing protein